MHRDIYTHIALVDVEAMVIYRCKKQKRGADERFINVLGAKGGASKDDGSVPA
jgi:hypothetical protein